MKRIILPLMLLAVSARAQEPSNWSGLWRVVQQGSGEGQTLFVQIQDADTRPVLYSTNWKEEILSDWKVNPDDIFLNWQFKSFNTVFQGQRTDGKVEGVWKSLHPQYRLEDKFVAERVFSEPVWTPEGGVVALGAASGFADLSGLLLEKASEGETAFGSFFQERFMVDYYAFWPGSPSSEELYTVLSGSSFPRSARTFSDSFESLSSRVSEKLKGVEFNLLLVSLPYGEPEAVRVAVHGGLFVLVNPEGFISREDPEEYEIEMAHKLFKSFTYSVLRLTRRQSSRLFHDGASYYLTSLLGYSEVPADFLLVPQEDIDSFEADRETYLKRLAEEDASLSGAAWAYFSYDFVKGLMEGKAAGELAEFYPVTVETAFRKYVGEE